MSTALTERVIVMMKQDGVFDQNGISADVSVQAAKALSFGTISTITYGSYVTTVGSVDAIHPALFITLFLSVVNDATVVGGIAAFALRWPDYVVNTYSRQMVLGV